MDLKNVCVKWDDKQTGFWWNETCSLVLEHFGLPGERYTSHPTENEMLFKFFNSYDATMCRLLLSERL
jgi:hypothetical protein